MNENCPPAAELERLLKNDLSEAQEQALDNHVADCESCQRRLEELTRFAPKVQIVVSSHRGNGEGTRRPGGVLARLANSSKPALRLVKQNGSANGHAGAAVRSHTDSTLRRIGHSSALLASRRILRRQFWIWPLIAAVLLGGVGWWVHRSVENALRQQRISELNMVLDADLAALRGWMGNQRAIAQLIADDEGLRHMVRDLLALADGTPATRARLVQAPAQTEIRARLTERIESIGFTGFLLLSPTGTALAMDDDAPVGKSLRGSPWDFFAGVWDGKTVISKPFLSPLLLADRNGGVRADQPCMYAAAPILDDYKHPIAALGLRMRPDDQFTRILQVARSGSTGETYAFDRNGLLLTQSRFEDDLKQVGLLVNRPESRSILSVDIRDPGVNIMEGNRPTIRREDQPLTRMAGAAVQGSDGHDVDGYRDYRGVLVVGAWKWLDDYDFGVTTEVDVAEAFALASILRDTFALLMSLLIATSVGILLAMLHIARQQRKLRAVASAAPRFGQYTLLESLGTGGMGTVYKAQHALLRRPTAVKLLNPEKISDAAIARFEREVQLTSGLTHPNTVGIYDFGRTDEGVFYYAMEYLEGVNLDELVDRYGPLPDERVVYILLQICASLAEAHSAGLIHRDVKPANIFLTLRGGEHDFIKVLDFGLARLASDHGEAKITSLNTMAGTPLYVAPEAITHPDQVDARADVYAIGAVGYYLLTGTPVFTGSGIEEICLMHLSATPRTPSARLGSPVNPELEAVLMGCLAKFPSDRPHDATELLHLLEKCPLPSRWTSTEAARWWLDHDKGLADSVAERAFSTAS